VIGTGIKTQTDRGNATVINTHTEGRPRAETNTHTEKATDRNT